MEDIFKKLDAELEQIGKNIDKMMECAEEMKEICEGLVDEK